MSNIEIVSPGYKSTQYTHSAATTSKVPLAIGTVVMLPLNSELANVLNSYAYEAQLRGPLKSGDTPALGATLYWDPINNYFTVTTTSNIKVGRAVSVADANGDIVVDYDAFNAPA